MKNNNLGVILTRLENLINQNTSDINTLKSKQVSQVALDSIKNSIATLHVKDNQWSQEIGLLKSKSLSFDDKINILTAKSESQTQK